MSCVSSSPHEPRAITKNCLNSLRLCLRSPSAILKTIDAADLRIWDVSPYCSFIGKTDVDL